MKDYIHSWETPLPIYRGNLVVILSNSPDKVKELMPEFNKQHVYGHSFLVNWNGTQGFVVILNFDSKYRPIYYGTIVHEVIHIVNMIMEARDIEPSVTNDEPTAYLAEWVSDKIYNYVVSKGFVVERNSNDN